MTFTKNLDEGPFGFRELVALVRGKTITSLLDTGGSLELCLSDDYVMRIDGDVVNIARTTERPDKNPI